MLDDNKAQMEMDLIMNEQKDPVSGNTAPIGAKPSEVRDDIDIRVSEGEFVVNAQTVRYFGEEFFNELQEAAAQGFERIKEGDELPFRDDELDVDETEDQEVKPEGFAYGGAVKGYAEGDIVVPQPVGGGYGGYGGTGALFGGFESKTYINPKTNQKMIVFFFNGRPMKRIPPGFVLMGATPAEEQARATQAPRDDDDDDKPKQESDPTWRNTPVEEWTTDMYENYSNYNQLKTNAGDLSLLEKSLIGLVGGAIGGPAGAIALTELARRENKKIAEKVVTNVMGMVDSDKNPDGSSLDTGTLSILNTARVNANYNIMNIDSKDMLGFTKEDAGPIASGTKASQDILDQQRKIVEKVKVLDPEKKSDFYKDTYDGGLGAFYGGSEEAETALITGATTVSGRDDDDDDRPVAGTTGSGVGYTTSTTESGGTKYTFDSEDDDDFDWDAFEADTTVGTNVSNVGNSGTDSDDNDKSSDKILCDLIYRYGYLDEDIWRLDEAFGDRVALEDPELLEGYHTWAKPMVAWIEKETFLSNLYLKYWCVPFTRRWANHIAHVMEPENYKPDYVGKLMLAVGVPISRAIYKLKGRKLKTV